MQLRRSLSLLVLSATVVFPALASAQLTILEPVAPPLEEPGTGLCMASAQASPSDFDLLNNNVTGYIGIVSSFLASNPLAERVLRSPLDLSNNFTLPDDLTSFGDFTGGDPSCLIGGCDFFGVDDGMPFFSRLRGFLNVTPELAGQPIHIGLYADDAVSLTFYDKNLAAFSLMIRPPQLGSPTWRLTETITFDKEGLYPVEIIYGGIINFTALEMSFFIGDFQDQELPAPMWTVTLSEAGFQLFDQSAFVQTLSGVPPFADPDQCQQCDRQFVNLPGNGDCPFGNYCNEAALCAPCDSALFCGPQCSPCGGASPFCININGNYACSECRTDDDCRPGSVCDSETFTCVECDTNDSCAGSSCNCCADGKECQPLAEGETPVCAECTSNADCPGGICDISVGKCVDELYENQRADCCGRGCHKCPENRPFCLAGEIDTACFECRWDTDCPPGNFCLTGQCEQCTSDRRCGVRCGTCEGDTPYCSGQNPAQAQCVRCTEDSHCGTGTCNLATNECEELECSMSCVEGLYCHGQQCVECYADTQCPCSGTCNLETNTCTEQCKTNRDCLGNEHCHWDLAEDSKECALGPLLFADNTCGQSVANTCSIAVGGRDSLPTGPALFIVAALLWARRRRRSDRRAGEGR